MFVLHIETATVTEGRQNNDKINTVGEYLMNVNKMVEVRIPRIVFQKKIMDEIIKRQFPDIIPKMNVMPRVFNKSSVITE